MLFKFAKRNTGIIVAKIMINPPSVGVPFFSIWPSNPRSRIDSPICFFLKKSIILFPKIVEISNEVIIAAAALNEIYVNNDAPGIWYWFSRNSKK